jgi:hypothetical protein
LLICGSIITIASYLQDNTLGTISSLYEDIMMLYDYNIEIVRPSRVLTVLSFKYYPVMYMLKSLYNQRFFIDKP